MGLGWQTVFRHENLSYLAGGIPLTLSITCLALVISVVLGLAVAAGRLSRIRVLRAAASAYIEFFRNVPALVLLFWIYFSLPALGIFLPTLFACSLSLGLNAAGYMAEIYRTGLQAVHKGQIVAGKSLGLSGLQVFVRITFPQALRIMLPLIVSQAATLFKWSSLVAIIGVADLTLRARYLTSQTFRPIEIFTGIALVYLTGSSMLSFFAGLLERKWSRMY